MIDFRLLRNRLFGVANLASLFAVGWIPRAALHRADLAADRPRTLRPRVGFEHRSRGARGAGLVAAGRAPLPAHRAAPPDQRRAHRRHRRDLPARLPAERQPLALPGGHVLRRRRMGLRGDLDERRRLRADLTTRHGPRHRALQRPAAAGIRARRGDALDHHRHPEPAPPASPATSPCSASPSLPPPDSPSSARSSPSPSATETPPQPCEEPPPPEQPSRSPEGSRRRAKVSKEGDRFARSS